MSVFKKTYTAAIPDGAERFRRGGVEWVRWKDRAGRRREGRITASRNGTTRALVEAATYSAKYRDATGVVRVVPTGCKDRTAALAVLGGLQKRVEQVRAGIMSETEAAAMKWTSVSLAAHLADFRAQMEGRRLSRNHVNVTVRYLELLFEACRFKRLSELSRQKVENWLGSEVRNQRMGARVHNAYIEALTNFGNWALRQGRTTVNPFGGLRKLNVKADPKRPRRALTLHEVQQLIEAAQIRPLQETLHGNRGAQPAKLTGRFSKKLTILGNMRALAYKTMVLTGLRLGELRSIHVSQVYLDHQPPFIELRAADEKARRGAQIPLPADLAADLSDYISRRYSRGTEEGRAENVVRFGHGDDPVLFDLPKTMTKVFNRDLAAAGIATKDASGRIIKKDSRGRSVDIHCLRHTYATLLAQANVPLQTAQRLMRHTDPKLTANVYTHLGLLDMAGAVSSLPVLDMRKRDAAASNLAADSLAPTLAPTPGFSRQIQATHCITVGYTEVDSASVQHAEIANKDSGIRSLASCDKRKEVVGVRGFEPPTSWSRTKRAKPGCATPRRGNV